MTRECQRCGEAFDPDREPTVPGVDTSRCPECGKRADVEGDEDSVREQREEGAPEDACGAEAADGVPCPRCDERLPSRDHLADHLTNEGVFSEVVAGTIDAPDEDGVEDVTVDVEVTVTRG